MAKKSIIAREKKRQKLVAKYADLRKRLKEEGRWEELDKLPKNSSSVRLHNRCQLTGAFCSMMPPGLSLDGFWCFF